MVKKHGFSIIELIIVVGLLSILMLAISSSMLMSIVSTNRIRKATNTKQAGAYAINQIQSMLRNAREITICNATTVTILNPDGNTTTLSTQIVNSATRIASNSGIYLTPSSTTVSAFSFTCLPADTPSATSETNLIKIAFDLKEIGTARSSENPTLHFETSTNLRN
jgi:prepilin-type N-terminal cleavage/methylation domain-containing protein